MLTNHRLLNRWLRTLGVLLAVIGALLLVNVAAAEPLRVSIPGSGKYNPNEPYAFYVQVLKLALEKTRVTDGDFYIHFHDHTGGIERDRAMLMAGVGIDVMWASVTKARAQKLRVIDVDLLKDLNNYRVLLIHKSAQPKFDQVQNLEQLKKFKTGTGPYWTDGVIMRDNGFELVYGASYQGLFKMLGLHRYDFLSRGLHEIGNDLIEYSSFDLVQESTLLLKYDQPIRYCFFVNKKNKPLADRIERGLKIAQADGSFDQLFLQMPTFKYGYDILQNTQRRILIIKNRTNL